MRRIAVIGASGLVGSTLVERLLAQSCDEVLAFIHSSGNAMRLARRSMELRMLDLLDAPQVERALAGVTHVVNCSRGGEDVMLGGLKNLLAASKRCGVRRFIHLSSVAVYGDPPPTESVRESASTRPERGSYGWMKLKQDEMVQKAVDAGLPALILCPPYISGPYSYFLLDLLEALRARSFALVDDGTAPCNTVDVSNLCHAIDLALSNGPADGARMFVTDDEDIDWRDVTEHVAVLIPAIGVQSVSRAELSQITPVNARAAISLTKSLKHLVSSDVREAMRKDPLWEKVDIVMRRAVARMGSRVEDGMRLSIEGPMKIPKLPRAQAFSSRLTYQQLRGVRHSCALAKTRLGYKPLHTVAQSMEAFRTWYRAHHGVDTPSWPLLRELYLQTEVT